MVKNTLKDQVKKSWYGSVFKHFKLFAKQKDSLKTTVQHLIEEHKENYSEEEKDEIELLKRIFSYGELEACDVMIPRPEIDAIDETISYNDLMQYIKSKQHTRYPVYSASLDTIKGYINIKDLFFMMQEDKKSFEIKSIIREVLVVPPSIKIIKLLSEMKLNNKHIAIVVDEYGGTDGLLTIEDIIEEIIGEIQDEHDTNDDHDASLINDHTMIANARLSIDDFEKLFKIKIELPEEDECNTIGGVILNLSGRVPEKGEVIRHPNGIEFEVIDANSRKINKVIIRKYDSAKSNS